MTRKILPLLLVLAAISVQAQESKPEDSARAFTQDFYHWYLPLAAKETRFPAYEIAIKKRPASFTPDLLKALQEDAEAQAKISDDIVGLDFDPFLYSQDSPKHLVVTQVNRKDDGFWVYLRHSKTAKGNSKPDVIAVVIQSNGQWCFSNFRFPDGGDLLDTLRLLKQGRQRPPK